MADTPTRPDGAHQTDTPRRDNRFHYYSGGEVKEIEGTRVSPLLWGFWSVVIVAGLIYFVVGGGLGPDTGHGKGFQPTGGSQAHLNGLQGELNQRGAAAGITYASVDLSQLPIPAGQTVDQAVKSGAEVYQSYCIGCHGPNQDGNGVNAGSLNPKPRNLRDAPFMQAMSYQRITTSLHKGVPGTAMPRWENLLTDREIGNVIAYVFSLTSPPPGSAAPQATAEKAGAQSGGSKTFVNGVQNSPKPITPAINGNPTAPTQTAPPSLSGPAPDQTGTVVPPNAAGAGASKPLPPSTPDAGGSSVAPAFSPGVSTPKPAAPTPGGSRTPAATATPNPTGSGTGTGM